MQGQLFTQDFLTRGVTETPPYQELNDTAFAAFKAALQSIFNGLDSASTINEAQTEALVINKVLVDLSLNLKGAVGQRLIRGAAGAVVPAVDVMAKNNELGMATFDQPLYDLHQRGELTAEQAVEHADSRPDAGSLRMAGS